MLFSDPDFGIESVAETGCQAYGLNGLGLGLITSRPNEVETAICSSLLLLNRTF